MSTDAPPTTTPAPATTFLTPSSWTEPLVMEAVFPKRQPLEVDLGCGKGRFLMARARHHPDRNFLGVDRLFVRLQRLDRRILRANLPNLRLLRIENDYATQHLLSPCSVAVFYVFFPDPWPKRRHHRKRLFTPEFLAHARQALMPGGIIHVATDHADYAEQIFKLFARDPAFEPAAIFTPSDEERTDFECHYVGQGHPIHRGAYRLAAPPCGLKPEAQPAGPN